MNNNLRVNSKTWWRRTGNVFGCFNSDLLVTLWLGTFETSYNVLVRQVQTYHWDVFTTYHRDVVGCFIWDYFETSWRRNNGASLSRTLKTLSRRSLMTSWRHTTNTFWRRTTETSLGVSFETKLKRRRDVPMVRHC